MVCGAFQKKNKYPAVFLKLPIRWNPAGKAGGVFGKGIPEMSGSKGLLILNGFQFVCPGFILFVPVLS